MSRLTENLKLAENQAICHRCRSIAAAFHPFCTECGLRRPRTGWAELEAEVDPWLGRVVGGSYLVAQVLGIGATARVYRVQCLERPRRFALKIVELNRSKLGKPDEIAARVRRETEAATSIESPHVVPIHEVLRPSRHTLGMLMGYAEGQTLHDLVRESGPLSVEEALQVTRHAALGLGAAHEQGFVHRDVKPANLMVHRRPQGPFTRVMDFGIVYATGDEQLTSGFLGTPMYTSPEQAEGVVVTPASDVYSLGATLYFALTGEPPFDRSSAIAAIRAHALDPVPRLSDAAGSRFSNELEELVARLLAKSPDDRPQSMEELVRQMEELEQRSDYDHVLRSSLRETSELRGLSETMVGEGQQPAAVPAGSCMVPFPIEGQYTAGGLAAMSRGRIVSLVDDDLAVTTLSPRIVQRFHVDFAEHATSLAVSNATVYVGTSDGAVLSDQEAWWQRVKELTDPISALATSTDDHVLAVGTSAGDLHVRRGSSWNKEREDSPIRAVAVASSGQTIAYGTWDRIEVLAGSLGNTLNVRDVVTLCFSEDEYLLAAGTKDGVVSVWTLSDGEPHRIHRVQRSQGQLLGLYFARETLLGLWRDGEDAFLVDMQCSMSDRCSPSCVHCPER